MATTSLCNMRTCFLYFEADGKLSQWSNSQWQYENIPQTLKTSQKLAFTLLWLQQDLNIFSNMIQVNIIQRSTCKWNFSYIINWLGLANIYWREHLGICYSLMCMKLTQLVPKHIIYIYSMYAFLEKNPQVYGFYLLVVTETRVVKKNFKAECDLQALFRVPDVACWNNQNYLLSWIFQKPCQCWVRANVGSKQF